jgi:solute carrier family 34 (sodium-dependent phosphate cotransporter)
VRPGSERDGPDPSVRDDIGVTREVHDEKLTARPVSRVLVVRLVRILLLLASLFLFVVAIELVKAGASGTASLVEKLIDSDSMPNALGLGWLATYLLMSGSPVAAVSVAFLAAGVVSRLASFAMVIGSRLGASFLVLFIGLVYVLRGHERRTGLSMGLLSFVVTGTVYLPALVLGALLLASGWLEGVQFQQGVVLGSLLDRFAAPLLDVVTGGLPGWAVVLLGLAVLWVSFYLFDRVLPNLDLERSQFSQVARLVYRPLVMFILGAALTAVTLSVSLSLSLLVPLSTRGYVRRENAIPYIMGANITTFLDTLLATVLLGSADALTVVLVSMVSVTLISLLVLLLLFRPYERLTLGILEWATASNRNLILFMAALVGMPLIAILI